MFKTIRVFIILIVLVSLGTSCRTSKQLVYLTDANTNEEYKQDIDYGIRITNDDMLSIIVSCNDPLIAAPYNSVMMGIGVASAQSTTTVNRTYTGYLVDKNGEIEFPKFGKIKVKGLTKNELSEKIKNLIANDNVIDPIVNIQFINLRYTVMGEVRTPGVYPITSERISIFDALGTAGDLLISAKRTNILITRDTPEGKSFARLDLTSKDILNSPYFYLQQNDVIYVEPSKGRIFQGDVSTYLPLTLSLVTSLIAILSIFR